jgi:hypothetical protein
MRLAALGLLALAFAACGGNDAAEPNTPAQTPVLGGRPTAVQLEFREQLLEQLRNGTYGDCDCNGDERARERIESGKVKPPPGYQLSTEQSDP